MIGSSQSDDDAEPGRPERWLVSYADLVTLLFALFLVLFAMNQVDLQKFQSLARALSQAMPSREPPEPAPSRSGLLARLRSELGRYDSSVEIDRNDRGVVVSLMSDRLLFPSGSTELGPRGRSVLEQLARLLLGAPVLLRIEGHTDNVPIATPRFPSNWELSVLRAGAVARYFLEAGFSPERLSVMGYAEQRPRCPNDTPGKRARNRRVEIVLIEARSWTAEP